MLFGTWIVLLGMVLYLVAAVSYAIQHHWTWALIYTAYALANVGLAFAAEGFP